MFVEPLQYQYDIGFVFSMNRYELQLEHGTYLMFALETMVWAHNMVWIYVHNHQFIILFCQWYGNVRMGGYCNGTTIAGINHISGTDSCGRQVVSAVAAETAAAASAVEVVVVVAAVVLVVIIVLGIVASSFVFCVVHRVRCSAPQCVYVCYAFCVCASCTLQRASLCVCVTLHVMST